MLFLPTTVAAVFHTQVREYNACGRGCIATMLDTKGPEVRSGDLAEPIEMSRGQSYTFTITEGE